MPTTTPRRHLPHPGEGETPDVPRDLTALALALDNIVDLEVGDLKWSFKPTDHSGWLLIDGRTNLLRSAYPAEIAAMMDALVAAGVMPGGDTLAHFSIPDAQGMTLAMQDAGGLRLPGISRLLGQTGGAATHLLSAAESGTNNNGATDPGGGHGHEGYGLGFLYHSGTPTNRWLRTTLEGDVNHVGMDAAVPAVGDHAHSLAARDADTAHNNMQPYMIANLFLFTGSGIAGATYGDGVGAPNVVDADYEFVLSDAQGVVEMNSPDDHVVTIPAHADVPYTVGTLLEVARMGAGAVHLVGAAGVTLQSAAGPTPHVTDQFGAAQARCRGVDDWVAIGNIS